MVRERAKLRIGVVGGSIAGCAAAVELTRGGHAVTLFERALAPLIGAGIGLLPATLEHLIARDLVDADLPRLEIETHAFSGVGDRELPLGHTALRLALSNFALHWSDLQRALRARVPDHAYQSGIEVRAVVQNTDSGATLALADGSHVDFDLVLFADGYRSLGRALVCPDCPLDYRDYTLWRGMVPESRLADRGPLAHTIHRISHASLPGHTAMYSIPAGDGRTDPAERVVNFASYLPLPAAELASFLVDAGGRARTGSLPPGSMRPSEEARLKALLQAQLPSYFASVVALARDTFAQPIFSVALPRHRVGRVALLGDAGTLVPPLTGSGVLKAIMNAIGLAGALRKTADVSEALAAWDAQASAGGQALSRLGVQMEQALVWQMPDLGRLTDSEARAFWTAATQLPS